MKAARTPGYSRFASVAVLSLAWACVVIHSAFLERVWLRPSMEPAIIEGGARALWGGRPLEADQPPRIFLDNDCYYWIRYAQHMLDTGSARVRWTTLDNVPDGRPVHWSSLLPWLLIGLAAARSLLFGGSVHDGVEATAIWVNPLLLCSFLVWMWTAVRRRHGPAWAAAVVLAVASLPAMLWDFGYGRPDHHGIHIIGAAGLLLSLILGGGGWISPDGNEAPSLSVARRWFLASSAFGALGLWVGATQQSLVIATAGLGAGLGLLTGGSGTRDGSRLEPALWRLWGAAGAALSLGLHALEYAPSHLGMRLEVNHPLYALAWIGGAEALYRMARIHRRGWSRPDSAAFVAALAVASILPCALFFGPRAWHALHDPYMRRIHDHIVEFQPLISAHRANWPRAAFQAFNVLPLFLPLGVIGVCLGALSPSSRQRIWIALVPALALAAWALRQVRWGGLFSAALICLGIAALPPLVDRLSAWRPRVPWRGLAVALFCGGSLAVFGLNLPSARAAVTSGRKVAELARAVAGRDVALNLRRYGQLGEVRVMSGAGETPSIHFFGGGRGTGSLYWENTVGIRAETDFFADEDDKTALRIAKERGITHVVVQSTPALAEQAYWVRHGILDPEGIRRTLAYRLSDPAGEIPDWLEPVPYYGSPLARAWRLRLFKTVFPRQPPARPPPAGDRS
jgi:hypothetical protein